MLSRTRIIHSRSPNLTPILSLPARRLRRLTARNHIRHDHKLVSRRRVEIIRRHSTSDRPLTFATKRLLKRITQALNRTRFTRRPVHTLSHSLLEYLSRNNSMRRILTHNRRQRRINQLRSRTRSLHTGAHRLPTPRNNSINIASTGTPKYHNRRSTSSQSRHHLTQAKQTRRNSRLTLVRNRHHTIRHNSHNIAQTMSLTRIVSVRSHVKVTNMISQQIKANTPIHEIHHITSEIIRDTPPVTITKSVQTDQHDRGTTPAAPTAAIGVTVIVEISIQGDINA